MMTKFFRCFLFYLSTIFCNDIHSQTPRLEGENQTSYFKNTLGCIAISPDGRYIARSFGVVKIGAKNEGFDIQVFDSRRLKPIRTLHAHTDFIAALKFDPDGHLISAGKDRRLIRWNIVNGEILTEKILNRGIPSSIDFNSNGAMMAALVYIGLNPFVFILETDDFDEKIRFRVKGTVTLNNAKFMNDSYILCGRFSGGSRIFSVAAYDVETGKELFLDKKFPWRLPPGLDSDNRLLLMYNDYSDPSSANNIKEFKFNGQEFQDIGEIISTGEVNKTKGYPVDILEDPKNSLIYVLTTTGVSSFDSNGSLLNTEYLFKDKDQLERSYMILGSYNFDFVNDRKHIIVTDITNASHIIEVESLKEVATLYSSVGQSDDYILVTPDGRMEGSIAAAEKLYWNDGINKVPLSATFDQMYTPNLGLQIFTNELEENKIDLTDLVKYAPEISIQNPDSLSSTSSSTIELTVNGTPKGNPIKEFRVFVNDKLISTETRGFRSTEKYTTQVSLLPGENIIKAVAISDAGYQSPSDQVIVTYSGQTAQSNLHILAIGINQYKNPLFNLNYAIADAKAFTDYLSENGKEIFQTINITYLSDSEAIKPKVFDAFSTLALKAKPQDVFVFYYAGHGVMSEGYAEAPADFHLALHDITQIYGRDELLKEKGISAAELRELSKGIAAQKQMIVLDACQSGGAIETFARRGAAEQKAMLQLARSAGTVLLASTGSEQFATEFEELGHGVFTYSLLEGFKGKADGGTMDKKITVKELESYLNDRIPELSQQYKGTVQYPMSWSRGQDFPVTVVK